MRFKLHTDNFNVSHYFYNANYVVRVYPYGSIYVGYKEDHILSSLYASIRVNKGISIDERHNTHERIIGLILFASLVLL